MQNKRIDNIDFLRGIAIFLVIWGHIIQYSSLNSFDFFENTMFKIIYSFHMPLFMLISGYVFTFSFNKYNLKQILSKRIQSLIQPIIICEMLCYYANVIGMVTLEKGEFTFPGEWISRVGSYWFLWSVLGASVVIAVSFKCSDKIIIHILGIILGYGFMYFVPNYAKNIYVYPYFVAGFLYGRYKDRKWMRVVERVLLICIPIFIWMSFIFKKEHMIYVSGITNPQYNAIRWAIGFVGSITAIFIGLFIYKLINRTFLAKVICKIGIVSLQVYVIQRCVVEYYYRVIYFQIMNNIGYNVMANNMIIYNLVYTPIMAILIISFIYLIIQLLKISKISVILFGK